MPRVSQFTLATGVSMDADYVPVIVSTGTSPQTYMESRVTKSNLLGAAVTYTLTGTYYPDSSVGLIILNQANSTQQLDVHLPLLPAGRTIDVYVGNVVSLVGPGYIQLHAPSGKKIDKNGAASTGLDTLILPSTLGAAYGPVRLMSTPNQDYAFVVGNVPAAGLHYLNFHSGSVSLPNGSGWQPWPNLGSATISTDNASMWNASGTPSPGFVTVGYDQYEFQWSLGTASPLVVPSGVSLELGLGYYNATYLGSTLQQVIGDGTNEMILTGRFKFQGLPLYEFLPLYRHNHTTSFSVGQPSFTVRRIVGP